LSNFGTITLDDIDYSLSVSVEKDVGSYTVVANPPEHYIFDSWETSGSVSVSDESSQTTTVTVNGDGELEALFKPKEPHLGLMTTYFPQYRFSLGEHWYPCSFYFDDDDITNNFPTPEDPIGGYDRYYMENKHYPPYFVYIHEVEDAEYLAFQYWLYYSYNSWWAGDIPLVSHSHDWESVWVIFHKGNLGEPYGVTYFAHNGLEFYEWQKVIKADGTNHPIVCIALGTHASYHPLKMAEFRLRQRHADSQELSANRPCWKGIRSSLSQPLFSLHPF